MNQKTGVRIWTEEVRIPTYLVGLPNPNPMFLEKRVYQGSSGKVYPYPVIDKIHEDRVDELHRVVFLENQYLKLMVMPGFGGRIQYAYDKTNNYPFIYHNRVIKPALVGLAGPWLSGGIEFNWPQHHRPGTYCPVDYTITKQADGSSTLWLSELEPMWHLKGTLGLTLHPQRALLEITIRLFNPTSLPQSFHLWTNPAVHVNNQYQSVFPPDVQAVYDHGKRDVSSFPMARGEYYKVDYSRGVDISWYKNIPVPTSYMAAGSDYDFVGGYDHGRAAGVLHVANHHVIPGKKQWVWGSGDFGKAWDRNLTDTDGPYAELMCGVFADNQPDFTWLQPLEEKEVKQFFLPYKDIGYVRNATIDAAVSFELKGRRVKLGAYATSPQRGARLSLSSQGKVVWKRRLDLGPDRPLRAEVNLPTVAKAEDLHLVLANAEGKSLVAYRPERHQKDPVPEPAKAIPEPEKLRNTEALWLAGQHLEQYRHATRDPEIYYREALRRDPNDVRNNNALGLLLLRRGQFAMAEPFFRAATKTQTRHNSNPADGSCFYNLGVCLGYLGRTAESVDAFYKATWSAAGQDSANFRLAQIAAQRGQRLEALELVNASLARNNRNQKAAHLKTLLLRQLGRAKDARQLAREALDRDPLDFGARNELFLLGESRQRTELLRLMRHNGHSFLVIAADYAHAGAFGEATDLLEAWINEDAGDVKKGARSKKPARHDPGHIGEVGMPNPRPMIHYFLGYYSSLAGDDKKAKAHFTAGASTSPDRCFPNSLDSILALQAALRANPKDGRASFYLGNLWYDKRQVQEATACWEQARRHAPGLATAHRNLALVYFNKQNNAGKALKAMTRAFRTQPDDARVLFELDLLKKRARVAPEKRLAFLGDYRSLAESREDLLLEVITLLNSSGRHQEAFDNLRCRKFHPWEGGEGKVTGQYVVSLVEISKELLQVHESVYVVERSYSDRPGAKPETVYASETVGYPEEHRTKVQTAIRLLKAARVYPENLGEGKLHGAQENHVLFWLGVAHDQAGDSHKAFECWRQASTGMKEPTPSVYYNDQNPETIFYQGLALRALGKPAAASKRFETLVSFGQKHLEDEMEIDYFAVSLPEFMVFDDDLNLRNQINCRYFIALGLLGLGRQASAVAQFGKVLQLEPAHQGARLHLRLAWYLGNKLRRLSAVRPARSVSRAS